MIILNLYLIKAIDNLFIQFNNIFVFFVSIVYTDIKYSFNKKKTIYFTTSFIHKKINASSCVQKYYPTNLLCANCNYSMKFGDRKKALPCKKPWLIDLNNCSFNKKYYYLIEDFKERNLLNIIESQRKTIRLSSDISTHINDTTSKHIVRKVKSISRYCVGITDSTDDKIKLYIAESLRMNATFYETDASLKINGLLPQNDLIQKKEIMSSIFQKLVSKPLIG